LPGGPERQDLRILADRTSLEIFANRGSMTMAFCLVPKASARHVVVTSVKGRAVFNRFAVREVSSIWQTGAGKKIPDRDAGDR
jgi:sucrose-6-phosphate hydrolase SacC (GH32 family)